MKKIIVGLLALVMLLGFAGCKKDAETKKKNVWSEKTIYIHGDDFYYSLEEAVKNGFEEGTDSYYDVFVCDNPGFTGYKGWDCFMATGEYKDEPYAYQNNPGSFETTIDDVIQFCGCGIFDGKAILYWGPNYSLNKENFSRKTVFTFSDNSNLTVYQSWYESEVYYKCDQGENTKIFWSYQKAVDYYGNANSVASSKVLVYDSPTFTKLDHSEVYNKKDDGTFPATPNTSDDDNYELAQTHERIVDYGVGIVNDSVIVFVDSDWGLKETKNSVSKHVMYFNDGSKLVFYVPNNKY